MKAEKHSDGIDFQQYWMTLKRHWLPFAIVFGSTVSLAAVVTLFRKPIYQGQGKLLLKVDSLSRLTGTSIVSDLRLDTANSINNEVEVLRSAPIAERIINALQLKNKAGETLTVPEFLKNLDVKAIRTKQNVLGQVLNAVAPTGNETNYLYYDQSHGNSLNLQRKVRVQDI
jgi:polysaccharide biosynthesis transport protein